MAAVMTLVALASSIVAQRLPSDRDGFTVPRADLKGDPERKPWYGDLEILDVGGGNPRPTFKIVSHPQTIVRPLGAQNPPATLTVEVNSPYPDSVEIEWLLNGEFVDWSSTGNVINVVRSQNGTMVTSEVHFFDLRPRDPNTASPVTIGNWSAVIEQTATENILIRKIQKII